MQKKVLKVTIWIVLVVFTFVYGVGSKCIYVNASYTGKHFANTGEKAWRLSYLAGDKGVVIPLYETGVAYVSIADHYTVNEKNTKFTKRTYYYYVTDSTGIKYGSIQARKIYSYYISGNEDVNFVSKTWKKEDGLYPGGRTYFAFGSVSNETDVTYTKSKVKKLSEKFGVLISDTASINVTTTISSTSSLTKCK